MPLKLLIQPGGEKWYALAKKKLAEMKDYMREAGLPAFSKTINIGASSKIALRSLKIAKGMSMDLIRITASDLFAGFIVYPSAVKLTAPFTTFVYYTRQEIMPVANVEIKAFSAYDAISAKYRRTTETLTEGVVRTPTPAGTNTIAEWIAEIGQVAWDNLLALLSLSPQALADFLNLPGVATSLGYFRRPRFLTVSLPTLTTANMVFDHTYTDEDTGEAAHKLLTLRPHTSDADVFEIGVATALSETGPTVGEVHDISPNGQTAIGLSGDTRTRYAMNYADEPKVTKSIETLSGYGQDTTVDDFVFDGPGGGHITSGTVFHSSSRSGDATYPVCFGFSASSTLQQIGIQHVYSHVGVHEGTYQVVCSVQPGGSGLGSYDTTDSGSASGSETKKLILPNGVERTFTVASYNQSAESSYHNNLGGAFPGCALTASQSSSITPISGAVVLGSLTILYADASLPAVIYWYVQRRYASAEASTMDRETWVVALVGAAEEEIYHLLESGVAADGEQLIAYPSTPPNGAVVGAGVWIGFGPSSGSSSATSSLDTNVETVPARKQVTPLSIAVQDQEHYVGQYTLASGATYIFGTGSPRQALLDRLTFLLEAKESALPPTITVEEQLFLNNIRAGTLTEYALKLERASPFGISLI